MDTIEYAKRLGEIIQRKLEDGSTKSWPELVAEASAELDVTDERDVANAEGARRQDDLRRARGEQ